MSETKQKIQFVRGPRSGYDSSAVAADAVYFATDTGEIFMNGIRYDSGLTSQVNLLTASNEEILEALGSIPKEHVTIQVRAKDWGEPQIENPEGVVIVDTFSSPGFPGTNGSHLELAIGDGGVVEFDVPYGYQYAVYSKVEGLGASFQLVQTAQRETRQMWLFNMPIGVWLGIHAGWYNDADEWGEYVPTICRDCDRDWTVYGSFRMEDGDYVDEGLCEFVLISTAETTFAMTTGNRSSSKMTWCSPRFRCDGIPTLPRYGASWAGLNMGVIDIDEFNEQYTTGHLQAMQDYNGALNSAKIIAAEKGDSAAQWCANLESGYNEARFLPSAGQLLVMQQNAIAINEVFEHIGSEDDMLPYYNSSTKKWVYPSGQTSQYWWSSTQGADEYSWVVYYSGSVGSNYRTNSLDVRAVSAFHFEYY